MYFLICRWISSGKFCHSVYFQTGDTDEGPALKKNHQEDATSDSKKTDLPTHNSIADTLLCSICQVWKKGCKTELHCFNKSNVKIQPHSYYSVHTFWRNDFSKTIEGLRAKKAYIEFWPIFVFCRIELIFGRLTCFDMKSIVP